MSFDPSTIQGHLSTFAQLRAPGPVDDPWVHQHDGGRHPGRIVFQAITHGDEVGPLPALLEVMAHLRSGAITFGGEAVFVLGNPEAALRGTRFVDVDLNRVFVDPEVAPGGPEAFEVKRAQALWPLYDRCELFIDFHQTSQPSSRPFYSGPWRADWAHWLRALGGDTAWLSRRAGAIFEPGTRCIDEYVRDQGRVGVTLELGEVGFTSIAFVRARAEMVRAMTLVDALHLEGCTIAEAAAQMPSPEVYSQTHVEVFADARMALEPGWAGFAPVEDGQLLSAAGTPDIHAPMGGVLLFPVYPERHPDGRAVEPKPGALFRIAQKIEGDVAEMLG